MPDGASILQQLLAGPDADLANFYSSNPAYQQEYSRVQGIGDRRDPLQWFKDFLTASPQDQAKYQDYQRPVAPPASASSDTGGGFGDMVNELLGSSVTTNPGVTAPASIVDRFVPTDTSTDASGILSQISNWFSTMIGTLGKPSTTLTVAPVNNTDVRETVNVDNSTHVTNPAPGFDFNDLLSVVSRIPSALSVPNGNNILSPANPPAGYGQNYTQSGPRTSGQTVASLTGMDISSDGVQIGATAIPWKTLIIGALLSLCAFILYKKFFK